MIIKMVTTLKRLYWRGREQISLFKKRIKNQFTDFWKTDEGFLRYWDEYIANATRSIRDYFQKEEEFIITNIPPNCSVLEVGSGEGRVLRMLKGQGRCLYGIDSKLDMVQAAKQRMQGEAEILKMDATKITFPENYFDYIIIAGNTFGILKRKKVKVLRECFKVTKPHGKIFLSVYSEKSLDERLKLYGDDPNMKVKNDGTVVWSFKKIAKWNTIVSEQFSREKITAILNKTSIGDFRIHEITYCGYMVEIIVKK